MRSILLLAGIFCFAFVVTYIIALALCIACIVFLLVCAVIFIKRCCRLVARRARGNVFYS